MITPGWCPSSIVGLIAAALGVGASIVEAAKIATAAGIVVGKSGLSVADRNELIAALRTGEVCMEELKVMTLEETLARVREWRRDGLSIGFANGVFDLIHPGHVALLSQAKLQCDRLIAATSTDASARCLKGDGRPIQPRWFG